MPDALVPFSLQHRIAAQNFEESKRSLGGFHFVAIQTEPDADEVEGFWLLKEVST